MAFNMIFEKISVCCRPAAPWYPNKNICKNRALALLFGLLMLFVLATGDAVAGDVIQPATSGQHGEGDQLAGTTDASELKNATTMPVATGQAEQVGTAVPAEPSQQVQHVPSVSPSLPSTSVIATTMPRLVSLVTAADAMQWESLKSLAENIITEGKLSAAEEAQAQAYLALANINLGFPGPALDAADKAVHLDSSNSRGWLMRGTAYMLLRQLASAEDDFQRTLQVDPSAWEACRNLAELSQARGDLPTALDWFAKAVALVPANIDLGMEYALLLHSFGLHAKADMALTNVITVAPDTPALFNNRGMIRLALDKYNDALSDFSRAITLDSTYEEALINRGNVLRAFKRYDDSLNDFTAGIAVHPQSIKLLVGRAYTFSEMGNYHAAATDMAAAYRIGNIDSYVLNEYAWFLATCPDASVRDGKRAVKLATEAIGLSNVPIPGYYDTLAAAYAEAREFLNAKDAQMRALYLGEQAGLSKSQLEDWNTRLKGYEEGVPYRNIAQ